MIARVLLPLVLTFAASALAAAPAPPPVLAPPPIPAPRAPVMPAPPAPAGERRYPVLGPESALWPRWHLLPVRSSPDWSDADIYPRDARRMDQEGDVGIELLVGPDGVPRACRIWLASRYPGLDDSTCDLGMTMRFAAPGALSAYRARLGWRLSDESQFGAGRLTARLWVAYGRVIGCERALSGAVPPEWNGVVCRIISSEIGHFLGERRHSAQRATVVLEMIPAGAAPAAGAPPRGRLTASRRTEFEVNRGGDMSHCRAVRDQGFAPRAFDYSGPCGLFLSQARIRRGPGRDAPGAGAMEINVYVEERGDVVDD